MTHHILDFSNGAALHVRLQNLVIEREGVPPLSLPMSDIACIIVAHRQVTFTQSVLEQIAVHGGTLVACDSKMTPCGMYLPLAAHHLQKRRIDSQIRASVQTRKRLWQQIIRAKVSHQAQLLSSWTGSDGGIAAMVERVKSGDTSNIEAQAAQKYWRALFKTDFEMRHNFRRDNESGDAVNVALNYGYAVLRAVIARAIVATGLLPSVGLHHCNKYNSFCLADDLMEPFRPLVDAAVATLLRDAKLGNSLEKETKQFLIESLTQRRYCVGEENLTLFETATHLAASLGHVFAQTQRDLVLPKF
ncbi:MAG: type II CRISPR-associated endonuclease Cas1 [Thermoguttaceae bacterium]